MKRDVGRSGQALRIAIVLILACATSVAVCANGYADPHPSRRPDAIDRHAEHIKAAARRFAVPERWIRAVMRAESDGDVRALSPAGAIGLMQIMPDTWAELRERHRLGRDPYNPRDNILAGAAYLKELHVRFGSPGFLAAYNAGPARYAQHLATGRRLPAETRAYVAKLAPKIGAAVKGPSGLSGSGRVNWASAPLFSSKKTGADRVDPDASEGQASDPDRRDLSVTGERSRELFFVPSRSEKRR